MSDLDGVSHFTEHRRRKQHAKLPTATAPEHQRGMRSFLTWSFILAQIAAADQMAGSAAAATATTDLAAGQSISDTAIASTQVEPAADALAGPDKSADGPAASATASQVHDAAATSHGYSYADASIGQDHSGQHAASPVISAGNFFTSYQGGSEDSAPDDRGSRVPLAPDTDIATTIDLGSIGVGVDSGLSNGVSIDISLPGINLDLDVPLSVPGIVGPVFTTVGDLVTTATDLVNPVLGVADGLVAPVLATAGDLVPTATELVNPVLDAADELVEPVLTTAGDIVTTATSLVDPVLNVADGHLEPVLTSVGDLFPAVTALVAGDNLGGLHLSLDGAVGSAGIIELASDTDVTVTSADTMFEGTSYTDLNVSLQTSLPGLPSTVASIASEADNSSAGGLIDAVLSIGGSTGHGEPPPGPTDVGAGIVASLGLDDATGGHHRSLSDLFG